MTLNIRIRQTTSTTGTGIVETADEFSREASATLDWRDGLEPWGLLPAGSMDGEYLPEQEMAAFDHRVEECSSSECTDESICVDCLIQINTSIS